MKLRESNVRKHKNILIVPSHGATIRRMRVKRRFVVALFVVIILGFAGYFVPFNHFSIDVVEQTRKHALDEQNVRIAADIKSVHRNLGDLNDELKNLERKKQEISEISGMNDPVGFTSIIRKYTRRQMKNADTLYAATTRAYALFSLLMRPVSQTAGAAGIFDRVPVSRPVRGTPFVLSGYGMKKDPFTGGEKMHYGVDFVVPQNDPVMATASGRVILVDRTAMWGYRVAIRHDYGFSSVYAHLGSVCVRSGENVVRGKRVGTAGQSGLTTGVHVHYELLRNGKNVNPELYFFPDWAQSKS